MDSYSFDFGGSCCRPAGTSEVRKSGRLQSNFWNFFPENRFWSLGWGLLAALTQSVGHRGGTGSRGSTSHGGVDRGRGSDEKGALNLEGASDRPPITATTAPKIDHLQRKIDHLQKLPGAS
jgi:hypothetical protein